MGTQTKSPFLERIREAIRVRHYSIRTERTYIEWTRRFILFHGKRHPEQMGETEVAAFLTHLAVDRKVAASTQNQAMNALVFVYRHVLDRPLGDIVGAVRAKRPARLPVVLSKDEVRRVLAELRGAPWLIACLQYGSGLRQIPAYSPPDLLRRPQAPRLRRFAAKRILTGQASTFPVRSVAKTPYPRDLEPPRDDRVTNKPG